MYLCGEKEENMSTFANKFAKVDIRMQAHAIKLHVPAFSMDKDKYCFRNFAGKCLIARNNFEW